MAAGTCALLALWIAGNVRDLTSIQHGTVRLVVGLMLFVLILIRPTAKGNPAPTKTARWHIAFTGLAGLLLYAIGTMLDIHQMVWLGVLFTVYAGLSLSLPGPYRTNILPALFVLYWIHWLPDQVFSAFQFHMQEASVRLSEWLLHMLNARVWADQFIIHTLDRTFEIPEACSGMKTATTVFLLAMGLGILFRLTRLEFFLMLAGAVLQALILNVFRITFLIRFNPPAGDPDSIQTLHEAGGFMLLATLVLVTVEIVYLSARRIGSTSTERALTPTERMPYSDLPPFWQFLIDHRVRILAGLLLLGLTGGLLYKSRPYHEAAMIKDVAEHLRDNGQLEAAQRCADEALVLDPDNTEWQFAVIRIKLMRGRYAEVLADLSRMKDASPEIHTSKRILQAYAHMGLRQMEQAAAVVAELPYFERENNPMVAMVLSELGRYSNKPEEAAKHLATASRWRPNTARIRALYPYLRAYRKWDAIADSLDNLPFRDLPQGLSAVESFMNLRQTSKAGELSVHLLERWPEDPRLLEPLFYLASLGEHPWDEVFGQHLRRCINATTQIDTLATFFEKCFALGRPDLAWRVYGRIAELDATHPILPATILRHGSSWFLFRNHFLGIPAPSHTVRIDIRQQIAAAGLVLAFSDNVTSIPMADTLAATDTTEARRNAMQTALAEFDRRQKAGTLSLAMQYEYATVQEWAGQRDGARRTLGEIVQRFPDEEERARMTLSELYERAGDWDNVYEILRRYPEQGECHLIPLIRLCEAQIQLKLLVAALHTAQFTQGMYPESGMAASMLASVHMELENPEEALFSLSQKTTWRDPEMNWQEAFALLRTQRYSEVIAFAQTAFLPAPDIPKDSEQAFFAKPAEQAALWHLYSMPRDEQFAAAAGALRENVTSTDSPFLRELFKLWLAAYDTRMAKPELSLQETWIATGRDRIEKAMALNQLTLFLAWQNKMDEAKEAAGRAVKFLPESPLLWRILISLDHVSHEVVMEAYRSCPTDPEIWLTAVQVTTQRELKNLPASSFGNITLKSLIEPADAICKQYPVATLTRAADYLYRRGMTNEAAALIRPATSLARGYLPTYLMGLRCAQNQGDSDWATECTRGAIDASLQPVAPLFHTLVNLRTQQQDVPIDLEMINALLNLRLLQPDDPLWSQILGYIRYSRGGWEYSDSFHEMLGALEKGATNRTPYIVAADASRLLGNPQRAVELLREARVLHPNDPAILNNLAFTLLEIPNGSTEALSYCVELEKSGTLRPEFADTIAWVHLENGQIDEAVRRATAIRDTATHGGRDWFRATLLLADAAQRQGRDEEAGTLLERLFDEGRDIPNEDILLAARLHSTVMERLRPATSNAQDGAVGPIPD